MNRVSVFSFRDDLSSYIDTVLETENPVIIERRGKPVAMLVPYKKEKYDFKRFWGFLGGKETGEEFLKRVRRSEKELRRIQALRNR